MSSIENKFITIRVDKEIERYIGNSIKENEWSDKMHRI